jgi:general secretion pathway protein D
MNKKFLFLLFLTLSLPIFGQQNDESLNEIPKTENLKDFQTTEKNLEDKSNNEEQKEIYLNFENAELSNFINYIAEIKKINLIPHKTLEGVKVSLTIREPLTVEGAWNVFLTVLEMSGFSIVKIGDVDVVIPRNDRTRQPLPAYINVPVSTLPDSDINIRYVTFLENISVNNVTTILQEMLSPGSWLQAYEDVNGLIITDKSLNIKSAMKVILALDQTGLQESVVVMRLKNANATDVKTLIDSLRTGEENVSPLARLLGKQAETNTQYFSPATKIIAEERTNSLILMGSQKSIKKIEDFIVEHVDKELKGVVSPLHIYELQHTDAETIRTILTSVTDTSKITLGDGDNITKYGAVRGGVKYFKPMTFEVDPDGNRLIVSSTDKQDWSLLKRTIEDLDKPQPQVAIESLFVTIKDEDIKSLGGALRNKKIGQIGKHINFQSPNGNNSVVIDPNDPTNLLGNMLNAISGGLGSTILSFGKTGENSNIWAVFKALQTQTNIQILSQPFITVTNKTEGTLDFGATRYVVKESSPTTLLTASGYEPVSAKTILKITPQINVEGIIRLTIDLQIQEFMKSESADNASSANTDLKKIITDVNVADGQVIALGGFIKSTVSESYKKTPILGDIPILGWLFKHKQKSVSKDYIFIFMSPTIIKPRKTPGTNLYTRMKLHQAKKDIDASAEMRKSKDPVHNWFFNPEQKEYSRKILDFANARYQPTTVDIKNDPYYRVHTERTDDISEFDGEPENTQKNVENHLSTKNEEPTTSSLKEKHAPKKINKSKTKYIKSIKKITQNDSSSSKIDSLKAIAENIDFDNLKINNPYKKQALNRQPSIKSLKKLKRRVK